MLLATLTFVSCVLSAPPTPTVCAVMGEPVKAESPALDYAGARYQFCCAGCDGKFAKDPMKYIAKAAKGKQAIAISLYDPVAKVKYDMKENKGAFADFEGIRYFFQNEENLAKFKANPKNFRAPKKEVLFCSVMNHEIEGYGNAGAYTDYKDVRYYFCCDGCQGKFNENPDQYASKVADKILAPKAIADKPIDANVAPKAKSDCCKPGAACCAKPDCCKPGAECCKPGAECCKPGAACCAKPDCCKPGAECCKPGAACCAKPDCCKPGAECCKPGAACCKGGR